MIKQILKSVLESYNNILYALDVYKQDITYNDWIEKQEKSINKVKVKKIDNLYIVNNNRNTFTFICVPFNKLSFVNLDNVDCVLVTNTNGTLAKSCISLLYDVFNKSSVKICYGDEDIMCGNVRNNPWLKPNWSPNTFLSYFYFGSLVAFRKDILLSVDFSKYKTCYELCYDLLNENGCFSKYNHDDFVFHIDEILYHTIKEGYSLFSDYKLDIEKLYEFKNDKISVIIPSKDNPKLLYTCINSFLSKTKLPCDIEFVVVDNGSTKFKNEIVCVLSELEKLYNVKITYMYKKMTFNYSQMCNIGIKESNGNYVLFLNDDIEIIKDNWLEEMLKVCILDYVGAVGAKLYYPESDIIQHVGITNLRVGPTHKLQRLSDKTIDKKGYNTGIRNVIGVTGACLLVRRDVFNEVNGFDINLAVAFNDVDLCFNIYKKGYYNVVLNDIYLYHHESISRGNDGDSLEKQLRLDREYKYLYKKHKDIIGVDPFYHKYFVKDFVVNTYRLCYNTDIDFSIYPSKCTETKVVNIDRCVMLGIENVLEHENSIIIGGYSFLSGSNNACYYRYLLLRNKENNICYKVKLTRLLRKDIEDNLENQMNVKLTGFLCKICKEDLPRGTYEIGIMYCNLFKTQLISNFANKVLEV